jgi:hypothetical protein
MNYVSARHGKQGGDTEGNNLQQDNTIKHIQSLA